ncbi:ATP synthase F1 subunit delta [Botrimarina sp.]|uniref:ATP synthase F1 subunit delta n=1 Tax=Botrimarina sp. TaxID=2795802 RepID=UPI0032EE55D1
MAAGAEKPKHETVLDVTAERIARTYAEALLGAAGDSDTQAVEDLEAVVGEVLAEHPKLAETLRSAFVDHPVRIGIIDRVFGGRVSPTVVNFLKVLSAHNRMNVIRLVAREARELLDDAHGRVRVRVRLAHAADDALLAQIEQTVREKTGAEPVLRVEVDPDLVGGLEIRVGDTVYDGTVRTAFAKAHRAIVAQTVLAIESNPRRFTLAE